MPAISKIRFTNVVYEGGDKRYNDDLFLFDGNNGAIVLENGGGKTVFIQTALQAIIPHVQVANRKMKNTLRLDEGPAHIAIEWILNERPRRYALTVVTLFLTKDSLDSFKYVYEYSTGDSNSIEQLPFVRGNRPADKGEMQDYYSQMASRHMNAYTFDTIDRYQAYIEENFHIISSEWESIVKINSGEGDVERFFDECKTTGQLIDRLLIPNIEDAMAGFESNKFADSFEARLDSFRQYKQFQDRLEEYRKIQLQVNELTDHFKRLDERRLTYEANQSKAKAYFLLSEQQHSHFTSKLDEASSRLEQLEQEKQQLRHKELSLVIAKEREILRALEEELGLLNRAALLAKEKSESAAKQLARLKLSEQINLSESATNRIGRLQKELSDMEQTAEASDTMEQFEEIQQQLAGAFADRQESLNKELESLKLQQRQYADQLQDEKGKSDAFHSTIERTKLNEREEATHISYLRDEMEQIKKSLLVNEANLSMEDRLKQWATKQVELDAKITHAKNRNSYLKQEKERTAGELEDNQKAILDTKTTITQRAAQLENLKKDEQIIISRLQSTSMLWTNLTSIHDRQESIAQSLLEEVERHTLQMERLLIDERIATRLFDDYNEQQRFFADPFLHEQIKRWRDQFSYVKTGIEFIVESDQQITDEDGYPYWAMALITTTKEVATLLEKLQGIRSELQFPVHVLTLDDASQIIRGERRQAFEWIIPAHWSTSTNKEQFEQWKEEIRHEAEIASETRQNYSIEVDRWKRLQETFVGFIRRYPVEHKQALEQELNELRQKEFQLNRELEEKRRKLSSFVVELETNQSHIENWDNEMQGIARNIEKAQNYITKEKQRKAHEESLFYYREELSSLERQSKKIERFIDELKGELEETKDAIGSTENLLYKEVLGHTYFAKVKNVKGVSSNLSIHVLSEAYEAISLKVAGLISERNLIERELRDAERQLEDAKEKIDVLHHEHPEIASAGPFPPNGTEQIKSLTLQVRQLVAEAKTAHERESEKEKVVNRQKGVVETRQSDVVDPISFQQPLAIEETELKEAWVGWEESRKSAKREQKLAGAEKDRWFGILRTLEIKSGEHQFLVPELEHAMVTEKEQTDFTYDGKGMVQDLLQLLTKTSSLYADETRRVEKERTVYTEFCRTTITDSRLQQTAVQGIESRRSYEEMLEYKQLLEQRLHMAEQYAEQHIHTHDKELELFLRHMSTHVIALRDELEHIPRRTSVKIEDNWRQIFHITVPEWQENEGKMLLRSHMNWILDQLERETFQTEIGLDEVKVRQSLEKWLNSRQLLQVVLQNKPIRISCHKVTNDNKITRASFTWEESNNWSGGEKWSKNMSLFLGILNYVAEKKQHIQSHMKRHRSVILDNPFGKASSGHVLTPVFFIAEQLGFQIITLTAHAEGKFLRDFFPIVYSCRLRQAVGTDRQVMTTKKTVQSAFLQDLEPASIERLNQTEQLDLFEVEKG